MTVLGVLAFLVGLPLLVLGLIRLVQAQAAQQSARERGDVCGRRAVDARWAVLMMPGALLIQWGMHPLTNGRTIAMIVGCVVVFAIAATLLLQWRGMLHGGWRRVVDQFFLSGMVLGDSVASAIGWHRVRYATTKCHEQKRNRHFSLVTLRFMTRSRGLPLDDSGSATLRVNGAM